MEKSSEEEQKRRHAGAVKSAQTWSGLKVQEFSSPLNSPPYNRDETIDQVAQNPECGEWYFGPGDPPSARQVAATTATIIFEHVNLHFHFGRLFVVSGLEEDEHYLVKDVQGELLQWLADLATEEARDPADNTPGSMLSLSDTLGEMEEAIIKARANIDTLLEAENAALAAE